MKIKNFLKKFIPASSNTFNYKTDTVIDLLYKINNNQLYTENYIKAINSSIETFMSSYDRMHSKTVEQISKLSTDISELNKLCFEIRNICHEDLKVTKDSYIRNDQTHKELLRLYDDVALRADAINNLINKNENIINEISADIKCLGSDNTRVLQHMDNIISDIVPALTKEIDKVSDDIQSLGFDNMHVKKCVDSIISDIVPALTKEIDKVSDDIHGIDLSNTQLMHHINELHDNNSVRMDKLHENIVIIKESSLYTQQRAEEVNSLNAAEQKKIFSIVSSVQANIENSEKLQTDNTTLLNNIMRNIDDSCEKLIKTTEVRATNRSNHNISKHLWSLAAEQTAEFVTNNLPKCITYPTPEILREKAISHIEIEGLYLEFGVLSGKSINQIADLKPKQILYGFDSYNGLPETWRTGFYKDKFATNTLPAVRKNVSLVVGMFDETLPDFIVQHTEPCAYIHIDCDLYSSTKTIFKYLKDKIVQGTVIVFDEFFNYPSWQEHEYKAFCELVAETGIDYEFIGYVPNYEQAAIIIK